MGPPPPKYRFKPPEPPSLEEKLKLLEGKIKELEEIIFIVSDKLNTIIKKSEMEIKNT